MPERQSSVAGLPSMESPFANAPETYTNSWGKYSSAASSPHHLVEGAGLSSWPFLGVISEMNIVQRTMLQFLRERKPRELIHWIPKGSRGLDVGAGFGQYTQVLRSWGYDVIALEPDGTKIAGAGAPYVVAMGEDIPFGNLEFDFAFAVNVLHHVEDVIATLREMARVARIVIIGELNADNPLIELYHRLFMREENPRIHLSVSQLEAAIEAAGLQPRRVYLRSLFGVPRVHLYAVVE